VFDLEFGLFLFVQRTPLEEFHSITMLKVGLTGGIGSGKSTVAKIFGILGIPVYYADDAAKRLMNEDEELKAAIIHHFGTESYINNQLNRSWLASLVFNNEEKLALLNSITHPATIYDANKWMENQNSPYVIKEAALLFESGSDANLDYVIGVYAPAPLRIRRTMQRDHITEEEVLKRMARQMNEEDKIGRCDFVITNDEREMVIPQVLALHNKLVNKPDIL
jgi:dephospho-CoA kinase